MVNLLYFVLITVISLFLYFFISLFLYFFISLFLTELLRRYSLKANILDIPGERNLHSIATPRGGGLSIVVIFLIVVGFNDLLAKNIVFALMGSGILVAAVGYWDGQGHIAAKWRLLSHFIAAFWVLFYLGRMPEFQLLGFSIDAGWIGIVVVAFLLVWLCNPPKN